VTGELCGPAVYYSLLFPYINYRHARDYVDTISIKYTGIRANYRESFFVDRYINDSETFTIKNDAQLGVQNHFERTHLTNYRVVLIPEVAKREGRFVIELKPLPTKG
jgi:hypothetical protein